MYTHELTLEQQTFAENHHNLVCAFLHTKKLSQDDYYDVVIFGYLRAVQQYCVRADLRQKYSFSTIAWRKMTDDLYKYFKTQMRRSQIAVMVSLESPVRGSESMTMAEVVSGPDRTLEQLDASFLWEDISACLTREQADMLHQRADGYTTREIAARHNRRLGEIEDVFTDIQASVCGLCLV